mmetsp:Transcript_89945/g.254783  ORF Transcript_89945/g.254783 Transcript_89945/m.254783 type:complete len:217 (+) Transcript_89945:709-1359(+)
MSSLASPSRKSCNTVDTPSLFSRATISSASASTPACPRFQSLPAYARSSRASGGSPWRTGRTTLSSRPRTSRPRWRGSPATRRHSMPRRPGGMPTLASCRIPSLRWLRTSRRWSSSRCSRSCPRCATSGTTRAPASPSTSRRPAAPSTPRTARRDPRCSPRARSLTRGSLGGGTATSSSPSTLPRGLGCCRRPRRRSQTPPASGVSGSSWRAGTRP